MDYIQKTSVGIFDDAEEAIETAKEEHGEPTVTGHTPDQSQEVESEDDVQGMTDMAMGPVGEVDKDEPTSDESIEYTRSLAFKRTEAGIEPDTPEEFERAEETKERLEEIKMVNEELERQGQKRRYVASKSDAPDNAHIHEDAFGQYYYKALQIEVRPSDVAEYAGKEHHGALDKAEKAANTVEMMYALQGGPLLDANTVKAAKSWLERHLVLTDEDPGSNDTFSHEFKNQIASAISDANSTEKENEEGNEKGRVYVDSPSEAPDDVNVQEGPGGGYYYETGSGRDSGGDGGSGEGDDGGGDETPNTTTVDGGDAEALVDVLGAAAQEAAGGDRSDIRSVRSEISGQRSRDEIDLDEESTEALETALDYLEDAAEEADDIPAFREAQLETLRDNI